MVTLKTEELAGAMHLLKDVSYVTDSKVRYQIKELAIKVIIFIVAMCVSGYCTVINLIGCFGKSHTTIQ